MAPASVLDRDAPVGDDAQGAGSDTNEAIYRIRSDSEDLGAVSLLVSTVQNFASSKSVVLTEKPVPPVVCPVRKCPMVRDPKDPDYGACRPDGQQDDPQDNLHGDAIDEIGPLATLP